ncbi:MAG: FHA domain-containing protein [Candidatus Hydrogenedens sp.]|nr:FHA domain-containing protein [Candidatus Hydrogenedens sp.]
MIFKNGFGVTGMTDVNDDRTLAFQQSSDGDKTAASGSLIEVPKARLICVDTAQVEGKLPGEGVIHLMPGSEQTVGRGDTCTYPIPSRKLSRQHARIFAGVGAWGVEDLNSTNGIQVNRQKVTTAWLKHGDEVRFGPIIFRFELERPDLAGTAASMPFVAAGPEEAEGDRTMMVGSLGASRAVIEAVRKVEEPVPEIAIPRRAAAPAVADPSAAKAGRQRILTFAGLGVLVIALGVGAVVYYPTYQRQQQIAQVISRDDAVLDRVIRRAREISGVALTDAIFDEDVAVLQPVIDETWAALQDNPNDAKLINEYARARFLQFERVFGKQFKLEELTQAEHQAAELKARLDELGRRLATVAAADKADLATAIGLVDLAELMIRYHRFGLEFAQVAKSTPDRPVKMPTLGQLNDVDQRRDDFIRYRKSFNQALSRDYRLFYGLVQGVENRDLSLIGRWRELLKQGS